MKTRTILSTLLLPLAALFTLLLPITVMGAETAKITVEADMPGHKISPTLWGIFFEDINLSADGGIYPELVRNRNFEDSDKPDQWTVVASGAAKVDLAIDREKPVSAKNPRSLKVAIAAHGKGRAGVANTGFYGMNVVKGESYKLSLEARGDGTFTGPLTVSLESTDGAVYAKRQFTGLDQDWKKFTATLKATDSDPKARLVISADKAGMFWLDMVSLVPEKTWKGHGLRPDLMGMLEGLRPAFNRFPGGCWVEGAVMKEAYRWKETIGDPSERRTQHNIWGYEATHGLGFHEYLVMCDDLGCEPLFVINVGMSHGGVVPMDQMNEYVQDALDAIEYANGPVESKWGAVRAKAGHPAPFHLKYMEIGNENGGKAYEERWPLFVKAIREKHPEIKLVSNIPRPDPTGVAKADIVDEHYYSDPEFFIRNSGKYDNYDRKGPGIYVGEYAVTKGAGLGNLRGAVGEAAFMTGMERNSDVVAMASYAPLFCNANHKRWPVNLINYDSDHAYGIPSYYVQRMFAQHRGDTTLPLSIEVRDLAAKPIVGEVGVGTWNTQAEFKDITVTRDGKTLAAPSLRDTNGWRFVGHGDWKAVDGILTQSGSTENVRAIFGDKTWSDYTLSLKARKLGGSEGFLVCFGLPDENVKNWWNIGGWGNSAHGVEMADAKAGKEEGVPGKIETGRWYDIRVELKGSNVRCFLDGRLVQSASAVPLTPLYASASRDDKTGEIILKVVHAGNDELETEIDLKGITGIAGPVRGTVLTSAKSTDENTLDEPLKVAPKEITIPASAPTFRHAFPGNSVTVLRLKSR
jgi:alpha-L-arabinofuranosidase